jgi:hypothetical protein
MVQYISNFPTGAMAPTAATATMVTATNNRNGSNQQSGSEGQRKHKRGWRKLQTNQHQKSIQNIYKT